MSPRRLTLAALVSVSVLTCLIVAHPAPAAATTSFEFGSVGQEAGQMSDPLAVAVAATGDVYLADSNNNRIDKFDKSGNFLLAWGAGVLDGADELQTCTTTCEAGKQSTTTGGFELPQGVAVDPAGNVYATDSSHSRVEKFGPKGKFILMFGGNVNATKDSEPSATQAERDVCTAASGNTCTEGRSGSGNGEFSLGFFEHSPVAVGLGGDVYVGDTGRVQVFEPTGKWKGTLSLAGLNKEVEGEVFEATPTALTVDSAGNVFLAASGVEGVREFEPSGIEKTARFDKESFSVTALTVDASGDLYVGDENGGFHVLKYNPAATELASFAPNTVKGSNKGIAFSNMTGQVYASEFDKSAGGFGEQDKSGVWVLTPPPAGPVIDSESATAGLRGGATLEAQVNPEGSETTYHFEYVDQAHFQASGYASATSTALTALAAGFEDQLAKVELTKLVPGESYHWRVVATDALSHATTGTDQTLEETPAALTDGPWTEDVAATSATLAAKINPLGANTSYRLEYGPSASYDHLFTGNVGEGMSPVPVSRHLQELEPDTTYHYRLVTINEVGVVHGSDRTFTTGPAGESTFALPDGRAWELVSPAMTGGSVFAIGSGGTQAASEGGAITYPVVGPPLGENVESNKLFLGAQVLSRRAPGGWRSQDLNPPTVATMPDFTGNIFTLFSPDLTSVVVQPPIETSLSTEGFSGSPYVRSNPTNSYAPLVTPANTPPGTTTLEVTSELGITYLDVLVQGGTPGHVLLGSPLKLTENAIPAANHLVQHGLGNLYEWTDGRLQLVNVLPNGEATHDTETPQFAGEGAGGITGTAARVISSDGRRVAWTRGTPYQEHVVQSQGLYVRDMVEERTVQLGGLGALYQTMSSDGSRVFFLEKGDLYEYDAATGAQTELTANHGSGEPSAGVQESVSNVSEDGSYVYFVATGVLAPGGVSGEDNLYLLHEAGGKWATSYVATLSPEDEHTWHVPRPSAPVLRGVASRVSPDGRYLTFMSHQSLTGYDNIDAVSGQADLEVFLYDALTSRLVCASCNPSGARPVGVKAGTAEALVESNAGSGDDGWGGSEWSLASRKPQWLAGILPLWQGYKTQDFAYQPRYLSDSGRLFFDSPDALVPHDTNGLMDVYEYEPVGVGDCTGSSATFSSRSGGCVNLISSGTSSTESGFLDASETGNDVFFLTAAHLTAADLDSSYDVWDAHVCSASVPCLTLSASTPACSSGDSCKPAPVPQPELFGPAPSATFSGVGNLAPTPAAALKPLTRQQRLSGALSSCRKKYRRSKKRRVACERTAHKRYGHAAKRSRKANTSKRGGK